jgi:hypothetical protein
MKSSFARMAASICGIGVDSAAAAVQPSQPVA